MERVILPIKHYGKFEKQRMSAEYFALTVCKPEAVAIMKALLKNIESGNDIFMENWLSIGKYLRSFELSQEIECMLCLHLWEIDGLTNIIRREVTYLKQEQQVDLSLAKMVSGLLKRLESGCSIIQNRKKIGNISEENLQQKLKVINAYRPGSKKF